MSGANKSTKAGEAKFASRTAEFERILKKNEKETVVLRLFVTGTTLRSTQAIATIRALCDETLAGRYDLEVIDIYQQPTQASSEQIIAVPTLLKKLPLPVRRMVGDFSNRTGMLLALGVRAGPAEPKAGDLNAVIELEK